MQAESLTNSGCVDETQEPQRGGLGALVLAAGVAHVLLHLLQAGRLLHQVVPLDLRAAHQLQAPHHLQHSMSHCEHHVTGL